MHSSLPDLPVQYLFFFLSFFLSPTTIVVGGVVSPKICRGFLSMCEDQRESFSGGTERSSLYRLLFVSLSLSPLSRLVCFLQRIA
jgi:hypothetical protein